MEAIRHRAMLALVAGTLLAAGAADDLAAAQRAQPATPNLTIVPNLRLVPDDTARLKALGSAYARSGNLAALQSGWQAFLNGALPPAGDIDALVQIVVQEASRQAQEDLKAIMAKVKAANDAKQAAERELGRVREAEAALARGQRALPFKASGVLPGIVTVATAADLAAYRKRLEDKLKTTGDDAQLANLDLQNILQKQQQTMQMMSNISKQLHDTAMAIIKKIGG
jgi:hypothetical protein